MTNQKGNKKLQYKLPYLRKGGTIYYYEDAVDEAGQIKSSAPLLSLRQPMTQEEIKRQYTQAIWGFLLSLSPLLVFNISNANAFTAVL